MTNNALLEQRKFVAPEFVFGPGAWERAGMYCRNYEARRVLLVTDPGLLKTDWVDRVRSNVEEAGCSVVQFSDISANPRESETMEGARLFREEGCDVILALGGGSPMDCAKVIGIVHTNGLHALDFEGVDQVRAPGPPLICIPTTAGTSADVSQFAIITDTIRKVKIAIVSKTMVPDTALIDPVMTTTMDQGLTACTGLDALTHAVEAYVSNASSATSDLLALDAVRTICAKLLDVLDNPRDVELRSHMMLASLHAGLAFSNAILGAVHAMAHSLGGFLDLPHGECNAILLPHVMAYNWDACPEKFANLAYAMGVSPDMQDKDELRQATVERLQHMMRSAGVHHTLGDLGVTRESLPKLASLALNDPCMLTNPRSVSMADIEEMYARAL